MADTVTTPVIGGGVPGETSPAAAALPQASPAPNPQGVTAPTPPSEEALTRRGQGRIDWSVGASPQGANLQLTYTTPQQEILYEDGASRAQTLQFGVGGGYGQREGPILTLGLNNSSVVPVENSLDGPQTRTDSTQAGLRLSLDGPGLYAGKKSILTGDGGEQRSNAMGGVLSFNPSIFYSNTTAATNPDGGTVTYHGGVANQQELGLSASLTGPGFRYGGTLNASQNRFFSAGFNSSGIPGASTGPIGNFVNAIPSLVAVDVVDAPDSPLQALSYARYNQEDGSFEGIATNGGYSDWAAHIRLVAGFIPVAWTSGRKVGDIVLSEDNKTLANLYNAYIEDNDNPYSDILSQIALVFPPAQWPTLAVNPSAVPEALRTSIPGFDPAAVITPDQIADSLMQRMEALYRQGLPEQFNTPEKAAETLQSLRKVIVEAAPFVVAPVTMDPEALMAQDGNRVTAYSKLDYQYVLDGGASYEIVERDGKSYLEISPIITAQRTEASDPEWYSDGRSRANSGPKYEKVGEETVLRGKPLSFPVESGVTVADALKIVLNDPEAAAVVEAMIAARQTAANELSRILNLSINMNQLVVTSSADPTKLADSTQFNHALAAFLARDPSALQLDLRRYTPA